MPPSSRASKAAMERHWKVLCDDIGHRTAGFAGEQQAADYIQSCFKRYGLANIHQQKLDFPSWKSSHCSLKVRPAGSKSRGKRIVSARAQVYTVGGSVSGPLAFLQSGLPLDFEQPLRGKIGLLIGAFAMGDEQVKARVLNSGMKALLRVDSRIPFDWPTSIGAAPQWVDGYDLPTSGISYPDAISLVEQMPLQAELTMRAKTFPAVTQNVFGEIIGSDFPDEVIVVSGHHDCVSENVGADDNGSGVIFVLELARMLARTKLRRTVRFVSYGAEEVLSVGSYLYARSLKRAEQRQIVLAVNADSISSAVGTDNVRVTGTPQLLKLTKDVWKARKHPAEISEGAYAYSDHFPLNIVGVPSLSLGRPRAEGGGCWQLHSPHDTVEHVSASVIRRTIETTAEFLLRVANAKRLPFARRFSPKVGRDVATIAREVYRHPRSVEEFDYER